MAANAELELSWLATGERQQSLGDPVACRVGAADNENCVFAGDRAEDIRTVFRVDGFGDRLRAGNLRAYDEKLADGIKTREELRENGG